MKVSFMSCALLAMYVTLNAKAQNESIEPQRFSLNEAKRYAIENSPVLLNSARDVEIARKKIWESLAIGLPQAELNSMYSYSPDLAGLTEIFAPPDTAGQNGGEGSGQNPFGDLVVDPDDLKTNFSATIQVSMLLFNGQYLVGIKASKVYASLSKLAETKSRHGIIENITTTYFTALVARESKLVLDSTLNTVQKTLFQTEQLYKNGFAEITDVDQLKILVSNIKTNLSVTSRQMVLMERLLKFQMGIPINQQIVLTDNIDNLVESIALEDGAFDIFNVEENVDYQLLTTQEKLSHLNMRAQKALFLPTISGFYQRYEDFDDNFFNDLSPNTFGLSLNFPLFTSGQRISQVGQRKLEYLKAKTNREMASESLFIQYETAMSDYLAARDIYTMQKENKDLSLQIYKKAIIRFTEGVGSSLDLNQAQSQYFESQGSYFQALISFVTAKSKLESLLAGTEN